MLLKELAREKRKFIFPISLATASGVQVSSILSNIAVSDKLSSFRVLLLKDRPGKIHLEPGCLPLLLVKDNKCFINEPAFR